MRSPGTAVLSTGHSLTEAWLDEVRHLRATCPPDFDVWLCYDNSRADWELNPLHTRIPQGVQVFLFRVQEIARHYDMFACHESGGLVPGNMTMVYIQFSRLHPEYNHLWRLEYDIRFSGAWSTFFNAFASNDAALLATIIKEFPLDCHGRWMRLFKRPWFCRKCLPLTKASLSISRYSRETCRLLHRGYRLGWRGHDEVYVPTYLRYRSRRIEDIGGNGIFVAEGNTNRFYTATPDSPDYSPGTFVLRNGIPFGTFPDMLFHPLKE